MILIEKNQNIELKINLKTIIFGFDLKSFIDPPKYERGNYPLVNEGIVASNIKHKENLFNYTNNWNSNYLKLEDFAQSNDKCLLCRFISHAREGNSDNKDTILTIAFTRITGYWPFIRSLRTSKSKCTVVIFINNVLQSAINSEFIRLSNNCGVTFINIGDFDPSNRQRVFVFRFEIYFDFLIKRRKIFKRVILIDLYDTFFQGDPFNSQWDFSSFQVSNEPASASHEQHRVEKLLINDEIVKEFPKYRNICAGVMLGTTDQIIEFILLFFRFSNAHSKIIKANNIMDQEVINVMCKSGYL